MKRSPSISGIHEEPAVMRRRRSHPCPRVGGLPSREGDAVACTIAGPNIDFEVAVACGERRRHPLLA
jgi:hypothetical protein